MKREVIELSKFDIAPILCDYAISANEYAEFYDIEGNIQGTPIWSVFKKIKEELIEHDSDYCSSNYEVVVKRLSDDKYFKGYYTYYEYKDIEYGTSLIEVFPTLMTITVYK